MTRLIIHYGIHFIVPLIVALIFFKDKWKLAFFIMIATMLIDLDHLFADPIFDSNRCSINFHPLHSYYVIAVYVLLLIPKKSRILALGLLIHILADTADCLLM